jgi:enoyl-CoA hydratase
LHRSSKLRAPADVKQPESVMLKVTVANEIATVTLSRPPVNAINDEWVRAFGSTLDSLAGRRDWKVVHLRSDQKVFCAGADLKQVREHMEAAHGPDRMYEYVAGIQRLYRRIEQLPQVTLAEIGGAAMGGGLELALACDLRIAGDDVKLGLPEARLGLIPGAGGTQRLTRLCGRAQAARLIFGAEIINGKAARELGVVQWAVPRSHLAAMAGDLARRIATFPAAALAWSKACIAAAEEAGEHGYKDELEGTRQLLTSAETHQRVEAFFAGAR